MSTEYRTESAVLAAESMGHDVAWDPPAALTAARRWTCTRCPATVIDYNGNVYGSATTTQCEVDSGDLQGGVSGTGDQP